jgi:hypothetical protein
MVAPLTLGAPSNSIMKQSSYNISHYNFDFAAERAMTGTDSEAAHDKHTAQDATDNVSEIPG